MKLISRILLISNILISLTITTGAFQKGGDDFVLAIRQICWPDGKSLFGEAHRVMGSMSFNMTDLDDNSSAAFDEIATFSRELNELYNLNKSWFSFATSPPTLNEIISLYLSIIQKASRLNSASLMFCETLLRTSEISGVRIPGLTPQPERAAFYQELYGWRTGQRPDATHALKAIRIERERLDALAAEEEAKRKAEAEAKAAEQAARAAATEARDSAVRKPLTDETTSILRHRRVNTSDDQRAEEKQPLLRPTITAH